MKKKKLNLARIGDNFCKEKEVVLNTEHYSIEAKEVEEGIIIDVFHRHGDLIDTYTYWNDDVIEEEDE